MAVDYMDYLIADQTLIPEESQQYYSEKIIYMPNSYQVNVSQRSISEISISRLDLGLPEEGFVFCSFNNAYKITPSTFAVWMRILKTVDESVLWLLVSNDETAKNLIKEAKKLGINKNRLVFAKYVPVEEHLNRIKHADLFVDNLPYNAHTTSSDALRMGLPVLTCVGKSFASRVAASLLNAVGLPELITTTQQEYEALAIDLATNPKKLKAIKDKLAKNLPSAPLYDTPLFERSSWSDKIELKRFVKFYGMSSDAANTKHFGGLKDYRSSEGREVLVPYRGSVSDTVQDLLGGIRSTCTYAGAMKLKQLSKCTTFVRCTQQFNAVYAGK